MTKRKAITERMKIDALMYRISMVSGPVICGICRKPLAAGTKLHWDHIHAISMGGPHTFQNIRPTHPECNQAKGIKEHKAAAKVLRLRGETRNGPKKAIRSRPFPQRKQAKAWPKRSMRQA